MTPPRRSGRKRPHRAARQHRRPRFGLLPVLLACALALGGSSAARAGWLWLHLATATHEAPHAAATGVHSHGAEGGDHEHHAPTPDAPHQHDGVTHTHGDPTPEPDPAVAADVLSEFFLPQSGLLALLPGTPAAAPLPQRETRVRRTDPVDTPPPRIQV